MCWLHTFLQLLNTITNKLNGPYRLLCLQKCCTKYRNKVTLGRKVFVPRVGLEPTTLGTSVCCSTNWASRATGYGPFPSRISLHSLPLCHSGRQALLQITSDTSKWTLGRIVLVPGVGLEPTTLRSAALTTELAGQLVMGLVPAVFHYTYIKLI